MSRADYVYLVLDGPLPVIAFTVKYEMRNWTRKNYNDLGRYTGWRISDGNFSRTPVVIDLKDLADG